MNEELLNKALEGFIAFVSDSVAWAKGQIPLVCEEVLKYEGIKYLTWAIILLCLTLFFIYISIKFWRMYKEAQKRSIYDGGEFLAYFVFFGILPALGSFCGFISTLLVVIQIHVAPRVYLLNYFKELIE